MCEDRALTTTFIVLLTPCEGCYCQLHYEWKRNNRDQGWRNFLTARAQIIYRFQRNYSVCPWKFWRAKWCLWVFHKLLFLRNIINFIMWRWGPIRAMASSFTRFLNHTQRRTTVGMILWTSDQAVAETSTWQHTTLKIKRHPWPRRDSNPKSQQASGRRPTP